MNNQIENVGRFEIWGTWPPELLLTLRPMLERHLVILPAWCNVAHVSYCSNEDMVGADADCGVDFDYRRIRLRLSPLFFELTERERGEKFRHELSHGLVAHLYRVAKEAVQIAFGDNKTAFDVAMKSLDAAHEGVTCDVTKVVCLALD